MKYPLNTPIPISEVKDEPKIHDFIKKIESGEITFNTGDVVAPWTPEDIARLDEVLEKHYAKKEAKKGTQE